MSKARALGMRLLVCYGQPPLEPAHNNTSLIASMRQSDQLTSRTWSLPADTDPLARTTARESCMHTRRPGSAPRVSAGSPWPGGPPLGPWGSAKPPRGSGSAWDQSSRECGTPSSRSQCCLRAKIVAMQSVIHR